MGSATPPKLCPTARGAVGGVTPAMHGLTAKRRRAVDLLQYTAALPGGSGQWNSSNAPPTAWWQWAVELLQRTAAPSGRSGQRYSWNTLPHRLGAVGSGTLAMHSPPPRGSGQWNFCNTLPYCLGAVGSGTPSLHCRTAWGKRAEELLQQFAPLTWGKWAVVLLQCTASLPGDSGQWNSCNAPPQSLGGSGR